MLPKLMLIVLTVFLVAFPDDLQLLHNHSLGVSLGDDFFLTYRFNIGSKYFIKTDIAASDPLSTDFEYALGLSLGKRLSQSPHFKFNISPFIIWHQQLKKPSDTLFVFPAEYRVFDYDSQKYVPKRDTSYDFENYNNTYLKVGPTMGIELNYERISFGFLFGPSLMIRFGKEFHLDRYLNSLPDYIEKNTTYHVDIILNIYLLYNF